MEHAPVKPGATAVSWEPDLLSSVCHDLRAPLASILMGVGFLRRVLPAEDAAAARVLEAMHRSAQRMNGLIESFSDLARLQAHEVTPQLSAHALVDVVQTAYDGLAREAKLLGVTPALKCPLGTASVLLCDRERLVKGLELMAACALRVLPERGTITLQVSTDSPSTVRLAMIARPASDGAPRSITAPLPKPELSIARGLVALHRSELAVAVGKERVELSFVLPVHSA